MKTTYLALLFVFLNFGVNGQIEELKKTQDVRKGYIDRSKKSSYVSKSLYVDPFTGTGGHGHTYPGASAPFGMIQLSPDTRYTGWDGCSGYHYSDSIVYGFSHTHLSGTGVSDYGDLLIVPQVGKPRIDPGYQTTKGYGDKFTHDKEEATPGFYSVHLENGDIDVRLTCSERAGFHEYTFNKEKGKRFILLDLDHRDKLLSSSLTIHDKKTISGSRVSEAWATEQHFYFHLELNVPYQKARMFRKRGRNKLLLIFPKETEKISVKVGVSAVDEEGAKKNLQVEIPHWSFDMTRAAVTQQWNKELDKIEFHSSDAAVMTNFYTALYHSYLAPNVFSDVDQRYRGRDLNVHKLDDQHDEQYTVFSLWDTYRATHPLFTLTQVERTNAFVRTFLRQYVEGGDLPVWELSANETECMIGFHSVSVIADAFVKGIRNFNAESALEAMVATSGFDEFGKISFRDKGYIDSGQEPESVSKSLEYAYNYYCLSAMNNAAEGQIKDGDVWGKLENGVYNFVNHYDPSTGFMRARRNGLWFSPFDPAEVNFNYTEANSWQYSLYAPQAVGVLKDLLGGADALENWLDRLFTTEMKLSGRHQVDITGLIGQYAHGNEPSHHMAYLYNYTNAPEKTQKYVDQIFREMYTPEPDGLSGNEDCGQMSSWYVLSALGLYQMAPGNPYYELGRPLMNDAVLNFESGKQLNIKTVNNSTQNKYLEKVEFNGRVLKQSYISHEELVSGGELVFYMRNSPLDIRKKFAHAPTLEKLPETFVPLPYFEQTKRVFQDSIQLSLNVVNNENYTIYYTLDGTAPSRSSEKYVSPIVLRENTTVKMFAANETARSAVLSNDFVKSDTSLSLELMSEYANQYASSGPFALIDGVKGSEEYRTGDWQGFWAQDVTSEVSFDNPRYVSEVSIGCLSDMKSWIFLPESIMIEYSYDGMKFESKKITEKLEKETKNDVYPHIEEVVVKIPSVRPVKKIRIIVNNFGKCPDWHLGAGNDTWLFLDEIRFKE